MTPMVQPAKNGSLNEERNVKKLVSSHTKQIVTNSTLVSRSENFHIKWNAIRDSSSTARELVPRNVNGTKTLKGPKNKHFNHLQSFSCVFHKRSANDLPYWGLDFFFHFLFVYLSRIPNKKGRCRCDNYHTNNQHYHLSIVIKTDNFHNMFINFEPHIHLDWDIPLVSCPWCNVLC